MAKRATQPRTAPAVRSRDRAETERRILLAVGATLAQSGFRALGVNAVAARAGVDKVLVYRYFGGLPELLAAYAERGDFWYAVDDLVGAHLPPPRPNTAAAWLELVLRRHVAWLKEKPVTLEIMAWEMVERNELTIALAEVREARGMEAMERIARRFALPATLDLAALVALFAAATNYLLVRSRGIRYFQGLDLRRDEGWERLFAIIGLVGTALLKG